LALAFVAVRFGGAALALGRFAGGFAGVGAAASVAGLAAAFLPFAALAPLAAPLASGFSSLPFSASNATISSSVASSMAMARGRFATVLPCCAYGPKRPFRTSTATPSFGCVPSSRTFARAFASNSIARFMPSTSTSSPGSSD